MTKEEWISEANRRIQSNNEFIDEIDDMIGSDWSRNKTPRENAIAENTFLKEGIRIIESI